ncbi:MAG: hypothetical protein U5J97_06280 [Trueperaceae bacterium]|nr:hypothetical protein [Trueperaceae bacterium]
MPEPSQDATEVRRRGAAALLDTPLGQPCGDDGAVVEIEGVGRAVYDTILFDGAEGIARLSGGVCIEVPQIELRLRADVVELSGLNVDAAADAPPPVLRAGPAVLGVAGWRLRVEELTGPVDALSVRGVIVLGAGVVGTARNGRFSEAGSILNDVSLATSDYLLDARSARLEGSELVLTDASGTSCTCGVERYRLLGRTVRTTIPRLGGSVEGAMAEPTETIIEEPRLRILGVEIPLGDELVLGPDGPRVELPVEVAERDGLGTVAVLRQGDLAVGRLELGVASEPHLAPLASLRVQQGGTVVAMQVDGRGLDLTARDRRPLGSGVWAEGFTDLDLQSDPGVLRSGGTLGWSGRTPVPLGSLEGVTARLDVRAGAEIAAEPATVGPGAGSGPASIRLPGRADARVDAPLASWARASLRVTGQAVAYPGAIVATAASGGDAAPSARFGQAAVSLEPSIRFQHSGSSLELGGIRRWSAGASPFAFDEIGDRARISADAVLAAGPVRARADVLWRFAPEAPGAEDLEARLSAPVSLGGGWSVTPAVEADLAGLAGGPSDEDWLEARLDLAREGQGDRARFDPAIEGELAVRWDAQAWTVRSARAGVRGSVSDDLGLGLEAELEPGPWTLSSLQASAWWPIDLGGDEAGVRLVPYVALDVAPWWTGEGGPRLAGHGLRAYLRDCCGTLIVGYRASDDDGVEIELGVRLPTLELGDLPVEELLRDLPLYGDAP